MSKKAVRELVLGLVHQGRSYASARGLAGVFSQGIHLKVDVESVLNDLVEDRRLEVQEGTYSVTEAGYGDLYRTDFETVLQQLNPLSGHPMALKTLIQKILTGKPIPQPSGKARSFELGGKFYNTTPLFLGEALGAVVGRSHNGPQIQIIEDQILFEDGNFDLMIYSLAQARYDDSIGPGRDNFKLKATYKGTSVGVENLMKKFAAALADQSTRYELNWYEVDEEGDVVGEDFELYS